MPRGEKGQQSRSRLMKAAAAEFARCGFHGTRVSDIVAAAGLTQAAFYLYFPSKVALFGELVDGFQSRLRELANTGRRITALSPEQVGDGAVANLEALFQFLVADPNLTKVGFVLAPNNDEVREQVAAMVAANLRINQAAGHIRSGVAVDIAAECIVGAVERLVVRRLLPAGERQPAELAREAADVLLKGLLTSQVKELNS